MASSSGSSSSALVTALQKRLNVQWKGAVSLLEQAKSNCEIEDDKIPDYREAEVLEEACEIFGDLTAAEQEALKVRPADDDSTLPDWKAKALRAAQEREAAARARAQAEAANETVRARLREQQQGAGGVVDDELVQNTKVIAIRKIETTEQPPSPTGNKAKVNKKTITCVCTIM